MLAAVFGNEVRTGRMFVAERPSMVGLPRWIINFPTKEDWRTKTKTEWIRSDIEQALGDLPAVEILVYEPASEYQIVAKRAGVEKLTPARI